MLVAGAGAAQPAVEREPPPPVQKEPPLEEASAETGTDVDYLLPDVPSPAMVYDGRRWWFRPIFAFMLDYTFLSQDDESIAQSGVQDDTGELRAGRLGGTLLHKGSYQWNLFATVDYQERATRDGAAFDVYDLRIGLPIGSAMLDIGKMKEPISYELSALSPLLPQQERILLPFYPTRSIGVRFSGLLGGERMTWAAGAFNDSFDSGVGHGEDGNDYVGRVTALAYESTSERNYLHLALSYRHAGSDDGVMRFAGRPESNVVDKILDTGVFASDHANEVGMEALVNFGPNTVLFERFDARADSEQTGFPRFYGYYVALSRVLTGEVRPYLRYAGGPKPELHWGALEVVARFSHVDLRDGTLDGGIFDKWYFGANWWISTQWKLGAGYGNGDLDKGDTVGNIEMMLFRLQWLY